MNYIDGKISEILKGKIVKRVYVYQDADEDGAVISTNDSKELNVDDYQGTIMIEFTDGTRINCWNSEWGGINICSECEDEERQDATFQL